jgi:hypothetical protein
MNGDNRSCCGQCMDRQRCCRVGPWIWALGGIENALRLSMDRPENFLRIVIFNWMDSVWISVVCICQWLISSLEINFHWQANLRDWTWHQCAKDLIIRESITDFLSHIRVTGQLPLSVKKRNRMREGGNPNNDLFWSKIGSITMLMIRQNISLSSLQIHRRESTRESEIKFAFYWDKRWRSLLFEQ